MLGAIPFTLDSNTTLNGAGTLLDAAPLTLSGNCDSFSGPTKVGLDALVVDGSLTGSAVTVMDGATLGGTGTVGSVHAANSGILRPGDNGPGILNAQGNLTLDPFSMFEVDLNGATAGTGFSQLNVTGTVDLRDSTFSPSLGFTPTNGETFTIIQSTAPITGTFSGLPEGASLTIGAPRFKSVMPAGVGTTSC